MRRPSVVSEANESEEVPSPWRGRAALIAVAAVAGCAAVSDPNPPQLWLAANAAETQFSLVPVEPDPF